LQPKPLFKELPNPHGISAMNKKMIMAFLGLLAKLTKAAILPPTPTQSIRCPLLGTSATVFVVCIDLYLTGAEVRTNEKNSLCKHKSYMLLLFDCMIQYNNSIHLQNKLWDFVDNK
jgi:hypothetical protein